MARPAPRPRTTPAVTRLEDRNNPIIITGFDIYTVEGGALTVIPAEQGVLANDFSTQDFGAVLQASSLSVTTPDTLRALPPNTVVLNPDGSLEIRPPGREFPDTITQLTLTYTVTNLNDPTEIGLPGTAIITVTESRQQLLAVGAGDGGAPLVKLYDPGTGRQLQSFFAYEETFTGGVRVATGDLNRDGVDDIVTVPGPGGAARVKVFDGATLDVIFDQIFLDPNFRGGGYVAVGDQIGNGDLEIVLGPGDGGGPIVTVIEPGLDPVVQTGAFGILQFFAYDPNLRAGVRVASADVTGTGVDFIVTAPGPGGGPHVKVFDAEEVQNRTITTLFAGVPVDPVSTFFAADGSNRAGVFVSGGDLDGDGRDEVITGTAGDGPAIVRVFNGLNGGLFNSLEVPLDRIPAFGPTASGLYASGLAPSGFLLPPAQVPNALNPTGVQQAQAAGLFVAGTTFTGTASGGVRVGAIDWNGDGRDELVIGYGPGNSPRVVVLDTVSDAVLADFLAFEGSFLGGVFVSDGPAVRDRLPQIL